MYRHSQIRVGNITYGRLFTADQVGHPRSDQDLSQILHTFRITQISCLSPQGSVSSSNPAKTFSEARDAFRRPIFDRQYC